MASQSAALDLAIIEVLKRTPNIRAIDIVNELSKANTPAPREVVNKILYHGPFDSTRLPGQAAPVWRVRAAIPMPGRFYFEIEGVAQFSLSDDKYLSEEKIRGLLKMLSETIVEGDPKAIRHDNTAGGKMVAQLAPEFGFTAAATP